MDSVFSWKLLQSKEDSRASSAADNKLLSEVKIWQNGTKYMKNKLGINTRKRGRENEESHRLTRCSVCVPPVDQF